MEPAISQRMPTWARWLLILAIGGALLFAVLVSQRTVGLVRPYRVPSDGMSPSIKKGDHIMVERLSVFFQGPKRGEIVVFSIAHIPQIVAGGMSPNEVFIQRLAGLPGDHLRIENEQLLVNGKVPDELKDIRYTTVTFPGSLDLKAGITVAAGHYFMLGDNSKNSYDSRYWGYVPKEDIKGVYLAHYWRNPGSF